MVQCYRVIEMNTAGRLLIVDDDPDIREVMRLILTKKGYEITEAIDGVDALNKIDHSFDLCVLDVMMPRMDGYTLCNKLREKYMMPVLFLTAKSQTNDMRDGYQSGADDYLPKPFKPEELVMRIEALIRRYRMYGTKDVQRDLDKIELEDSVLDRNNMTITRNGTEIKLTELELEILWLLASNPEAVYSARELYEKVWKMEYFYTSNNTVMVHIRNLRKKINIDGCKELIQTVWGKGYSLK
ncbi:MAG: response regulator transcription factor [Erysipelotrichaceae bacterium]|nr:response regulator transcription factor [Erysipelotrichaceae bacterium]